MFTPNILRAIAQSVSALRLQVCQWLALAVIGSVAAFAAQAQTFQPGETIEYLDRGSWPHKWERGVFVRELPGGKQVLIRRKPTPYFPQGSEIAYEPENLRKPDATPPAGPAATAQAGGAAPGDAGAKAAPAAAKPAPPPAPPILGAGLLSKEEVIAYARAQIGADPWKNPPRDDNLAKIRDLIRARGTNFSADADFSARMNAQSSYSSHIGWAVDANRGAHPALRDYFGTWLLRAANRGSRSTGRDSSGRAVTTTTDSQAESGQLTINADGSYVWQALRGDPESKWLRGRWRVVKPEEPHTWEGGLAIWLEKAKQGHDYMVRMGRDPAWPGWIDVGAGIGRTPVEYGRRP